MFLDTAALAAKLRGAASGNVVKVMLLGNSGRGKSLLCNACLGQHMFAHEFQPRSCTSRCEYTEVVAELDGLKQSYVLCNIPGLIESMPENVVRNIACAEEAFRALPGCKTVVLFVLGHVGGRLQAEDMEAYRSICRFAPELAGSDMFGFVVNGVDEDYFASDQEALEYKSGLTDAVHQLLGVQAPVWFTGFVPKAQQSDFQHPLMKTLQGQVLAILRELTPKSIALDANARLELDLANLKRELDEAEKRAEEFQRLFKLDLQQRSAEMQQKLALQQQQLNRQLEAARAAAAAAASAKDSTCTIL